MKLTYWVAPGIEKLQIRQCNISADEFYEFRPANQWINRDSFKEEND